MDTFAHQIGGVDIDGVGKESAALCVSLHHVFAAMQAVVTQTFTASLAILPTVLAAQGNAARPSVQSRQAPYYAASAVTPVVTAAIIARHLTALAADPVPPSAGSTVPSLERGAHYVAEQFAALELQPARGRGRAGSYIQPYPVPGTRALNYDNTVMTIATFVRRGGTAVINERAVEVVRSLQLPLATAAPLVGGMVGEGSNGRHLGSRRPISVVVAGPHTPVSAANIAVRDQVVFYVPPAGLDSLLERAVVDTLARASAGSRGVVVVTAEDSARFAARQRAVRRPVPLVDDYMRAASSAPAWTVYVRATDSLAQLFTLAGLDLAALQRASTPLVRAPPPLGAMFEGSAAPGGLQAANVVGVLEGSDSTLKQQYVVLTVNLPDTDLAKARGDIAGVAAVLALAEAFRASAVRPRRSVLFAVTSEAVHESAGAEFMATSVVPQSIWAPTRAAASLTLDLVGLSGGRGDSLTIDGLDEVDFGVLASWITAAHGEAGLTVVSGSVLTGPCAAHCAFVRRKVPSLAIHAAPFAPAGAPAPAPPDPERIARVARLAFVLTEAIANADRVRWGTRVLERLSRVVGD